MASSASSVRSTPATAPLRGHEQPRVFTPPLRPLTPETSLGFSAVEFAEEVLNIRLFPWQRWLLIHALEVLPDGSFRFRNVVVLVARQNGKSTLSVVLSLWSMYVLGRPLVIGTAQDLDVAEEIWQAAVDMVEETPDLDALKERVVKVNGKKSLELRTGERYKVKAANRRSGRGLSGDLILLDELREHQSWDAWGAVTKTTMARADAQIWALSNAGDAASLVLRYLRKMAHASLGDPDGLNASDDPSAMMAESPDEDLLIEDDDSLGIFEWSAPPKCHIWDRDGWCWANPSLGHGGVGERAIASAARTDPEWVFRTEVLCQWSDGTLEGPFPPGTWDEGREPKSKLADDSPVALCVDVSWDRSKSHIGLAGLREDGATHVEIAASRAGTEWVVGWLTSPARHERIHTAVAAGVALQSSGAPASTLKADLADAGVTVIDWKGSDLGVATGAFYDLVRSGGLCHLPQPVLDLAASTAVARPMGDAYVWDRKRSPQDASPLVAVTGAVWALSALPEDAVSKYESEGLVSL